MRCTNWNQIDAKMGMNDFDGKHDLDEGDEEWIDEDAGWRKDTHLHLDPFS